jgi:glycine oxidase
MTEHPEILIIGGGVIGLTCAYFLAREGRRVQVLDRGDPGRESSWAGAGILPPGNPDRAATPLDLLRAHSALLFPQLSAELRERTGIDNGYLRCGGLEFLSEDDAESEAVWREEGIRFESLDEATSRKLEPALAPGLGRACHLPDLGQVRNPRHLKALQAGCQALGVQLRPGCPLNGLDCADGRVRAVRTSLGRLQAQQYLLTTGAWTGGVLEELGLSIGIRPIRGQIVLLNARPLPFRRVLMVGARYLVPRPDGRVLVGATEEDVGFEKQTTAIAMQDLLALALERVPELAQAQLERSWAGLRPGSADGLPYLGAVPGLSNLFVAAGHFRAGIQLSPATALVMRDLLLGREPPISLAPFRLDRQPGPRTRVAFRS